MRMSRSMAPAWKAMLVPCKRYLEVSKVTVDCMKMPTFDKPFFGTLICVIFFYLETKIPN